MRRSSLLACFAAFAGPVFGDLAVQITAPVLPPPMVGVPLTFTAAATDTLPGAIDYRFSVSRDGGPYEVVVDYRFSNTLIWAPSPQEGTYSVQVSARNKTAGEVAASAIPFSVLSQSTGGKPAVIATSNPLVALYSAPPCPLGSNITVYFGRGASFNHTDWRACKNNLSTNFFIAGMLPNSTYRIFSVTTGTPPSSILPIHPGQQTSSASKAGPSVQFTTGSIPPELLFATPTVLQAPTAQADIDQNILLSDNISLNSAAQNLFYFPTATDLNGNVLWYYSALGTVAQDSDYFIRPIKGGAFLIITADPASALVKGQVLQEIDLAGNIVRETNATRVNEQLIAMGLSGITDFDHDALRLANGHTIVLCSQERIFPAGTQGSTVPIDILGNAIVDLDTNLQVAWAWSGYDHLDVNRAALLGENCAPNQAGCPPVVLAPSAADWLHGNSLDYISPSGDLLFSMRHQDWIAKIDYNSGKGTGSVLWELGKDGSFSIFSNDPYPWFSHQHDAEYELHGSTVLSLFDNGNTRAAANPGLTENSRGMVLNVNETALAVTPLLSQDLGVYSGAVGSAQRLDNGDYHFDAGFIFQGPLQVAQHAEFSLSGIENYRLQTNDLSYRSYRMNSLYLLDGLDR